MVRVIGKAALAMLAGLALVSCGDDNGGGDGNEMIISMTSSNRLWTSRARDFRHDLLDSLCHFRKPSD